MKRRRDIVHRVRDGRARAAGTPFSFATAAAILTICSVAGAAPGDLDPTFDGDGLVATDFPAVASERAQALVRQPDGKLVAAGYVGQSGSSATFALARHDEAGGLDSTFDGDGLVVTNFPESGTEDARALVVQPDGKIVAAGGIGFIPSGFALARYMPNGTLDSSFGGDGTVVTGFPPVPLQPTQSGAQGLVRQADGKLVAAGNTTGAGDCRFLLARYNVDGTLDSTFDGDGIAMSTSFVSCQANALALQSDGKLVVAGNIANNSSGSEQVVGLIRFNPDGGLDSTFDGDGVVATNFFVSLFETVNAIVVQPDGKLVAAGHVGAFDGLALARYQSNGSLDSGFDGDGMVVTALPARAHALALQPNGKLVAAGFVGSSGAQFLVVRYNARGGLDTTFSGDGIVETDFPGSAQEFAFGVVVQPNGKVVAAGGGAFGFADGFGGFALARYQPSRSDGG